MFCKGAVPSGSEVNTIEGQFNVPMIAQWYVKRKDGNDKCCSLKWSAINKDKQNCILREGVLY